MHQSASAVVRYPAPGDVYSSRLNPGETCKVTSITDGHVTYRWLCEDSHSQVHSTPLPYFIRYFAVRLYAVAAGAPAQADDRDLQAHLDSLKGSDFGTNCSILGATHSHAASTEHMGETNRQAPQAPSSGWDPYEVWRTRIQKPRMDAADRQTGQPGNQPGADSNPVPRREAR